MQQCLAHHQWCVPAAAARGSARTSLKSLKSGGPPMRCTLVLGVLGAAVVAPVHADYYDCVYALGHGTCAPGQAGAVGTYSTLDDCQAACSSSPVNTYSCGAGLWPGTQSCQLVPAWTVPSGQFLSQAACQASCSSGGQANVTFTKGTWMGDPSCNPSAPGCSDGQATPQGGCREPKTRPRCKRT